MIKPLEQLCLAVGIVSEDDARQVVQAVNRRVKDVTHAQIVKLYWRGEAEDGILLRPIAFINDSQRRNPQPFTVRADSKGVLEWVFREEQALWIEGMERHVRDRPLDEPLVNRATNAEIARDELALSDPPQSDCTVVVPIFERGMVQGLYSLEWLATPLVTSALMHFMRRTSQALSPLLYNADVYEYDRKKTNKAIERFLDSVQGFQFDSVILDQNVRTAFVARPFGDEHNTFQDRLKRALADRGIRANDYRAEGHQSVIKEIRRQIINSHFCVADLTGSNPNVVAEVGMMMVLDRNVLMLKRMGDTAAVPFNLQHFHIWQYDLARDSEDLLVSAPADVGMYSFGEVLDRFVSRLPPETGFFDAEQYAPGMDARNPGDSRPPTGPS